MMRLRSRIAVSLGAMVVVLVLAPVGAPVARAAGSVSIGIEAVVDASGNTTLLVTAPGCDVSPPGATSEIVVQTRNATTGEIGEGAVAVGVFTSPGQGSVVIPAATPVNSFLLTVDCNGGALHASQAFNLIAPASPVAAPVSFTG